MRVVGQTADDAPAPAESASGGGDCSSDEQQGTVLPFGYDPILICLTQGCYRRRRVVCDNGYASPRHLASHCCLDCPYGTRPHSLTCCEIGPQPMQGIHGKLVHPSPSLATQRLIAPPEPIQTALLPQLEQDDAVGEAFFGAQHDSGIFIDDGDDDELSGTESDSKPREDAAKRVTGWCNGDMVRADDSPKNVEAVTLGQMPHGRWTSSVEAGMTVGVLHAGALASDVESE